MEKTKKKHPRYLFGVQSASIFLKNSQRERKYTEKAETTVSNLAIFLLHRIYFDFLAALIILNAVKAIERERESKMKRRKITIKLKGKQSKHCFAFLKIQ
jgi:hypothetical protein